MRRFSSLTAISSFSGRCYIRRCRCKSGRACPSIRGIHGRTLEWLKTHCEEFLLEKLALNACQLRFNAHFLYSILQRDETRLGFRERPFVISLSFATELLLASVHPQRDASAKMAQGN